MNLKCIYCGKANIFGFGCPYNRQHEQQPLDETKCVYCGSTAYGGGCRFSPTGNHKHGSGKTGKCIWCGKVLSGFGCPYSPNKQHVR